MEEIRKVLLSLATPILYLLSRVAVHHCQATMVTPNSTTLVSQNIKDNPYHFISDFISIHQLIIFNHKHFAE